MPRPVPRSKLALCAAELLSRDSVVIPEDKLREIVESEPKLVKCFRYYNRDATGLDTYDRGNLSWAVAKSLGFEDWPCLGDTDETKDSFFRALVSAGYVPGMTVEMLDREDA